MSVHNPHSPTCIIAGEISSLASALASKLEDISCVPYFIPTKITTKSLNINQEKILSVSNLGLADIGTVKYVFYFAPESILETESGYLEHASLARQLVGVAKKYQAKTTYITRDPNEYSVINDLSGESFYKQSRTQITLHVESLSKMMESLGGVDGYQTRVVVKDLVGNRITRESPLVVEGLFSGMPKLIHTTRKDTHLIHPIDSKSVVDQIAKLTFSQNFSTYPYEIIGSQQLTLINAALHLKSKLENKTKTQTHIKTISNVENTPSFKSKKIYVNPAKNALELLEDSMIWSVNNPLKRKTIKTKLPKAPIYKKVSKPPPVKKIKKTMKFRLPTFSSKMLFIVPAILMYLIVPPTMFYFKINETHRQFEAGDYTQSAKSLQSAATLLTFSKPTVSTVSFIIKYTSPGVSQDLDAWVQVVNELGLVAQKSQKLLDSGRGVVSHIVTNQKGDIFSQLDSIKVDLEEVFNKLSIIQAGLSSLSGDFYSQKQTASIKKLEDNLSSVRKNLDSMISILKISANLLGREEAKTYLVLLQNNAELRPTGGFIGSFALATFDAGKLLDLETFDVYSADGQLKGHVEPPEAIKKHLGEANWYLRDSNWDPDFTVSARRAEWFLDKEMGRQVDGTIGINLYVIRDLLSAVGGVELSDYQETITADNLFQRAEYFSELNYFDGSTQKKDFISSLINSIYFKVSSPQEDFGVQALLSFIGNATKSHLQISLRDESAESILADSIFSGALGNADCSLEKSACLSDYISIIESNVGVNKVNYFVGRSIDHKVKVGSDLVESETTILLENKAETAAWPAGTYKNYIRFLIPKNASVKKVLVGGRPIKASQLDISSVGDKKIIGFLVEVPISSQLSASVKYSQKHDIDQTQSYQYNLLFEKQSGTNSDPVNIQVTSKDSGTPISTSLGEIMGEQVRASTNNDMDREMTINYIY